MTPKEKVEEAKKAALKEAIKQFQEETKDDKK